MNEHEVLDLLVSAEHATPQRQSELFNMLAIAAMGNADQLTLPDKVKLDGILELLHRVFHEVCLHAPRILPAYAPLFHAVCCGKRQSNLLGGPYDWSLVQVMEQPQTGQHRPPEARETYAVAPASW